MKCKKTYSSWAAAFALAAMVSCSKDEASNVNPVEEAQATQNYSEAIPGQFIVVYKDTDKKMGAPGMNALQVQQKTQEVFKSRSIEGAEILQVYSSALS